MAEEESTSARHNPSLKTASPPLRRPPSRSLTDLAYEAIVQVIVDRQYEPGSRLNIDALAAQLEMSNTPVREALTRAAMQRLVLQDNNRGFLVTPLLNEQEYHQLFDVRALLELHALQTSLPDQETLKRLTELAEIMPSMKHGPIYHDFKQFNQADREFHYLLISSSRNAFLIRAWSDLHFHLHVGRLYAGAGVIDFSQALSEHNTIVEALQKNDQRALVETATQHIQHAEARLRQLLPSR